MSLQEALFLIAGGALGVVMAFAIPFAAWIITRAVRVDVLTSKQSRK